MCIVFVVMMAELVAHYVPKICNATFYVPTSATGKKIENWNHLNQKVFRRIGLQFTPELIQKLATSRPGVIERVSQEIHFKNSISEESRYLIFLCLVVGFKGDQAHPTPGSPSRYSDQPEARRGQISTHGL